MHAELKCRPTAVAAVCSEDSNDEVSCKFIYGFVVGNAIFVQPQHKRLQLSLAGVLCGLSHTWGGPKVAGNTSDIGECFDL